MKFLFVLLFPCILASSLDYKFEQLLQQDDMMGFGVVILEGSDIIYSKGFGLRDYERELPQNDDTIYRIASISKTFTATSIMILKQRGLLDLDEDISYYMGYQIRNPYYSSIPITVRMIASHTSSLRDGDFYNIFLSDSYNQKQPSYQQILQQNGQYYDHRVYSSAHKPGEYFSYSNLGYGLLGTLVERISNQRFDVFVQENILKPLEINNAGFNIEDIESVDDVAVLYRKQDGEWRAQTDDFKGIRPEPIDYNKYEIGVNALIFGPQGGMRIKLQDLSKYLLSFQTYQILSKESVAEMQYPQWVYDGTNGDTLGDSMLEYGIGQHILTATKNYDVILPGIQMIGHSGFAYGLSSDMYYGSNYGVLIAITGIGHDYQMGQHSTFYRSEELIFEIVRDYLFDSLKAK